MVNFVLRDMADNKIDKDVIYGDAYVSLEFTDLQQGAVIMDGSTLSSHVNDSIFGNLTIEEVKAEIKFNEQPARISIKKIGSKQTMLKVLIFLKGKGYNPKLDGTGTLKSFVNAIREDKDGFYVDTLYFHKVSKG